MVDPVLRPWRRHTPWQRLVAGIVKFFWLMVACLLVTLGIRLLVVRL